MQQLAEVLRVKDQMCRRGILVAIAEYAFLGHVRYVENERIRLLREHGRVYDPEVINRIMDDYVSIAKKHSYLHA